MLFTANFIPKTYETNCTPAQICIYLCRAIPACCQRSGGSTLLQRLAVGGMLPHFLPIMIVAHVFMCGLCLVA